MASKHWGQPEFTDKLNTCIELAKKRNNYRTVGDILSDLNESGLDMSERTWRRVRNYDAPFQHHYRAHLARIFRDDSWLEFEPIETADDTAADIKPAAGIELAGTDLDPTDLERSVGGNEGGQLLLGQQEQHWVASESAFRSEFGAKGSSLNERAGWLRFRRLHDIPDRSFRDLMQNNLLGIAEDGEAFVKQPAKHTLWTLRTLFAALLIGVLTAVATLIASYWHNPLFIPIFTVSGLICVGSIAITHKLILRPFEVAQRLSQTARSRQ